MTYRNKKITESARGKPCTMGSPWCNGDHNTVVWCHSNSQRHGKGTGHKAADIFGFYGCSGCHEWYDKGPSQKEEKDWMFRTAHERSLVILLEEGVIK